MSSTSGTPGDERISFSLADIDLFAQASHDTNPLHTSDAYAHTTPFGRRVVHGMLATVACLGRLPQPSGARLARLQVDFKGPLFAGVSYRVEATTKDTRATVRLFDGRRLSLRLVADFGAPSPIRLQPHPRPAPRVTPVRLSLSDLHDGWQREGAYGPLDGAAEALAERFGIVTESATSAADIAILLGTSFLVGMEAPGEAALFSRAEIRFEPAPGPLCGTLAFHLVVAERDDRFDLVRLRAAFAIDGARVAEADLDAFVRAGPTELDAAKLRELSPPSVALEGRTAIVVGGSRGLGAAIVLALADQGAKVGLCYARSRASAERVAALAAAGSVTLLEVDAADASAFEPAARAFAAECGGLDVLVCNASPALGSLSLDPLTLPRVMEYVHRAVALAAVPLASTLDLLEAKPGDVVVISSIAVENPPPEWPHYVTAKTAIEGLVRAALAGARGLRGFIVRPPRLRTDLVGTPGSREQAVEPEIVAARIVAALGAPRAAGLAVLRGIDSPR